MNGLEYIRKAYGVDARRGRRIRYGPNQEQGAIITGARNGRLRVRFDGCTRAIDLHPTWQVTYPAEPA